MVEQAAYRHDLGNDLYLDAFSIDPNISTERLEEILRSADRKAKPSQSVLNTIIHTQHLCSIDELTLYPHEGLYSVPEPLKPYRKAIQEDWIQKEDLTAQF